MPSITYNKFDIGLDLRKDSSATDANRLRVATNCFVTTGNVLRKRPGMSKVETLEAGTVGLVAGGGVLNTFYETGTITHANSLFKANKIRFPGTSQALVKIHYGDVFNGYLYVAAEYLDGSVKHHYLGLPDARFNTHAYVVGDFMVPSTPNGYQYECTVAGTSAGAPPGTYNTTDGATWADNTVTWKTHRSDTAILDPACPNTTACLKAASKMWAVNADVVRYSDTNKPRSWTFVTGPPANSAGFLPTGLRASGSQDAIGLSEYQQNLAVFFVDGFQLWAIDPDPSLMAFKKSLPGIGTRYARSIMQFAGDVAFLAPSGYRSVTTSAVSQNLAEVDIGNPIDKLIRPLLTSDPSPIAIYYVGAGQFWCVMTDIANGGSRVDVLSYSRTAKLSAWTNYHFDIQISDIANLNGYLYLRAGDAVYLVDETIYADAGSNYTTSIELPLLNMRLPGNLKYVTGMTAVTKGSFDIQFRYYDENQNLCITDPFTLGGDTAPQDMAPVEITATAIAPVLTITNAKEFELHSLTFYFEDLGPQ